MGEKTRELTNLDPRITEFQDTLRNSYTQANKTAAKGQIVFIGSSLMEIFPIEQWEEQGKVHFGTYIYNRGVRATTTADVLAHMDTLIFDLAPSKVFINIGSNDIGFNVPEEQFLANYEEILTQIKQKLPDTQIFVMAYYPLNISANFGEEEAEHSQLYEHRSNDLNHYYSAKVADIARKVGAQFIDANDGLTDENGNLRPELTFDGAHMLPAAYEIVLKNLTPYIER